MIDLLRKACGQNVPRETFDRLSAYVELLVRASTSQNLIAASTIENVWHRHVLDSAQLIRFSRSGSWLDVGSGAGLPGMVTAIITGAATTLLELRRLRVEFLQEVVDGLELTNVTVVAGRPACLSASFDNIAARAVGRAGEVFKLTSPLSHDGTIWLLPKGRSAQNELDELRRAWQGAFALEPSCTDADASILIASGIRARGKR